MSCYPRSRTSSKTTSSEISLPNRQVSSPNKQVSSPNRQVSSRICNQPTNSIDSIISTPIKPSNNNSGNEFSNYDEKYSKDYYKNYYPIKPSNNNSGSEFSDYDEKYSRDVYKKKCKEYKQIIDNLKFEIFQKEIEMKDMEIKYLKSQLSTESKIFEPVRRYGTRHVTNNVDSTPINEIYS
ncbi:hypothetical protein [Bandra megavirus]|uniref:Uncharacterized protein n=2 Tax=unclassified Megavirus TaxID=3068396 RepID=A0A2K9V7G3_9VIRU|nr:hypothetical protein [Bandra megavirus]